MPRRKGYKHTEEAKINIGLGQLKKTGHGHSWSGGLITKICATCGKEFSFKRNRVLTAKYCSYKCRVLPITTKGLKRPQTTGDSNGNWKGGITTARQTFNSSIEWKQLCEFIYERESHKCRRCGASFTRSKQLHCHHIIPFKDIENRLVADNIVLLCKQCHNYVHSKENVEKEFIR